MMRNEQQSPAFTLGSALLGAMAGATAVAVMNKDLRKKLVGRLISLIENADKKLDTVDEEVEKIDHVIRSIGKESAGIETGKVE